MKFLQLEFTLTTSTMDRLALILGASFLALQSFAFGIFEEPVCSKYHFEEKVLEKLITLEIKVENDFKRLREEASARDAKLSALADSTKNDFAIIMGNISKIETMHERIAKSPDVVDKKKGLCAFFVLHVGGHRYKMFMIKVRLGREL